VLTISLSLGRRSNATSGDSKSAVGLGRQRRRSKEAYDRQWAGRCTWDCRAPPLVYLGPLGLGLPLCKAVPLPFLPRGLSRVLGGGALLLWFGRTFRNAETTFRIDKPVSRLVKGGPFRLSRNPGYPSLTVNYEGIAAPRNSLWVMLLLATGWYW
jgi:protein-S-isoprenylcysteine O-methyltransferase Ste14